MPAHVEADAAAERCYVSTGHLPEPDLVMTTVKRAYERFRGNTEGTNSDVYPALARVPADLFGVCVVGTSGNVYAAGDADHEFSIMSVSKPFVFALVCQCLGAEQARDKLGVNSTGLPFNALSAIERGRDGRTNPTACTYPSPDTLCGTTCSGDEQTPRVCSMGACIANSSLTTRCGAYTCDGETKCRSTCASASDCASGYTCVGDICKPAGNSCATDGHTAVDGEGNRTDCAPYLCSGGRCASTCSATADCLAPTVCDPMGQCVALPSSSAGGTSAAACACVAGGSGLAGGANWGAALAVAALAGARRRGRPRCGR